MAILSRILFLVVGRQKGNEQPKILGDVHRSSLAHFCSINSIGRPSAPCLLHRRFLPDAMASGSTQRRGPTIRCDGLQPSSIGPSL